MANPKGSVSNSTTHRRYFATEHENKSKYFDANGQKGDGTDSDTKLEDSLAAMTALLGECFEMRADAAIDT